MNFKGSQEARTKDNQQEEEEHIEKRIRRYDIQDVHPKDSRQQQTETGVDEDDEKPVDEGVSDAFASGFGLLREEAHRHGNHGENAGRQKRCKSEEHAQKEDASKPFLLRVFRFFSNSPFIRTVVAESLQRRAVIRTFRHLFAVGKHGLEIQVRREDAFFFIARHERDGTGDGLGAGIGTSERLDEVGFLLEHVDGHFKRRIELDEGIAFGHLTFGFKSLGPINTESCWHGPVKAFQMLAVGVPTRVHHGMEHQVKPVAILVDVHVPHHGLQDAAFGFDRFLVVGGIVVSTEVLRLRAVRWQRRQNIVQGDGEIDVFGREATRCVADHETQEAGHVSAARGCVQADFLHPVDLLLKELQIHHEVGVVFHERVAFGDLAHLFDPVRNLYFEIRGQGTVGVVEELAVDVPACVDARVEYYIQFVLTFGFMDREFPLDRFQDLCESSRPSPG